MCPSTMDLVVAIAIGVLATVFLGALVALVLVCRHRCRSSDLISQQHKDSRWVWLVYIVLTFTALQLEWLTKRAQ